MTITVSIDTLALRNSYHFQRLLCCRGPLVNACRRLQEDPVFRMRVHADSTSYRHKQTLRSAQKFLKQTKFLACRHLYVESVYPTSSTVTT
jgi:hypothetical protein